VFRRHTAAAQPQQAAGEDVADFPEVGWKVGIGRDAYVIERHAQLIHASFSQMKQENCNTRIRDRKKAFERKSACLV
jgi:hypothetical protein